MVSGKIESERKTLFAKSGGVLVRGECCAWGGEGRRDIGIAVAGPAELA